VCHEGVVHMSGYIMPQDEFPGLSDSMMDSELEEEEEEEDLDSEEDSPVPGISHYRQTAYFCFVTVLRLLLQCRRVFSLTHSTVWPISMHVFINCSVFIYEIAYNMCYHSSSTHQKYKPLLCFVWLKVSFCYSWFVILKVSCTYLCHHVAQSKRKLTFIRRLWIKCV